MKCNLFLLLLVSSFPVKSAFCQEKHALIIGIDKYTPPAQYVPSKNVGRKYFTDLDGCKNDALSIYSIITSRFEFTASNIDTLFDASANRDGILNAMNNLLKKSKPNDIVFIYYAGHGSQVKNSLSFELDKLDQTIVPANTWEEGVKDIRDKELSKIFNDFLDNNINLTIIFDCCHSGSISRGPNTTPGKLRYMPIANWDAKDASKYQVPEKREGNKFLIFSAAQSDEFAAEQRDDEGIAHGAFTAALTEALNQQSVDASALNIFTSARAILKSNGKKQEPVIGGTMKRQGQTLFGIKKGTLNDYSVVAVSGIKGNNVQLQAGFALGLYKENELAMLNDKKDTLFKLTIDSVLGVNNSLASVTKGNIKNIKPGYQFVVSNWVSSGRPLLKLYIPVSKLSDEAVEKFTAIANEVKKSPKIKWQAQMGKGKADPYATIFWQNDKCFIKVDTNAAREITNITAQNILQYCKKDSTLYVELPISKENAEQYANRLSGNRRVKLVTDAGSANYVLFGRLGLNSLPAYGLRKAEVALRDSLESMPVDTDCFELLADKTDKSKNIGDDLFGVVLKLSKIRGWLNLAVPDATKKSFIYNLQIFNEDKKQTISNDKYNIGDNVTIKLVADKNYSAGQAVGKPLFLYVFAIDQSGAMSLYYPEEGNVNNKFPKFENGILIKEIPLLTYAIPAPSGTDNFYLLACEDPINNASLIFNQAGVYSGVLSRGLRDESNPLSDLLDLGNARSRGVPPKLPATWSLQRFSYKCTY